MSRARAGSVEYQPKAQIYKYFVLAVCVRDGQVRNPQSGREAASFPFYFQFSQENRRFLGHLKSRFVELRRTIRRGNIFGEVQTKTYITPLKSQAWCKCQRETLQMKTVKTIQVVTSTQTGMFFQECILVGVKSEVSSNASGRKYQEKTPQKGSFRLRKRLFFSPQCSRPNRQHYG